MKRALLAIALLILPSAALGQSSPLILKSGHVARAGSGDAIIVTPDSQSTSALSVFGSPALTVATKQSGHGGGIISYLVNNAATNTNALPSALSAWGDLPAGATGNTVFGAYSLSSIEATTGVAVGHEVTVRNNTGSAPDTALPPNLAIGTSTIAAVGENLTCGGTANCSIGLNVTSEGGSSRVFNTGIYVAKFAQYGLLVDSNGGATGIAAKAGSNGLSLHLKNTGTFNAAASVADYEDTNAVIRWTLKQDGSITTTAGVTVGAPIVLAIYTVATLPTCNSALKGGMAFVTDATAPTYNAALTGGGTVGVPVACDASAWKSH